MEDHNEKLWGKEFYAAIKSFKAELSKIGEKHSYLFDDTTEGFGNTKKDSIENHYEMIIDNPPKFRIRAGSHLPNSVKDECIALFRKYFGP